MENQTNQIIEEQQHPLVTFGNKHKKGIIITISIIGASVLIALGCKKYLDATAFERWLNKASLEELKEKRDLIHAEYMRHNVNDQYREDLWNLLPVFDSRIRQKERNGKAPCGPTYHREHGYNLYKPD